MVITIHRKASPVAEPSLLFSFPRQGIRTDWKQSALSGAFEWVFVQDPKFLWFVCRVPERPDYDGSRKSGDFVEGLWERDVAEFFVREPSGRYQEFNISPAGAWWTTVLTSYRTRSAISPSVSGVVIETRGTERDWVAVLGVPLESLAVGVDCGSSMHVSAIAHRPSARFLSSKPVPTIEPDFHDQRCFSPVSILVES